MGIELKLIDAYKRMSDHTNPECRHNCLRPLGCCEPFFCESTRKHAEKHWNVILENSDYFKEGKTNLPLMGPTGCTAAPHLRPSCTLHVCSVNSLGIKPGDKPWTDKYYQIREEISDLEFDKFLYIEITEGRMKIDYNNRTLTDDVETISFDEISPASDLWELINDHGRFAPSDIS